MLKSAVASLELTAAAVPHLHHHQQQQQQRQRLKQSYPFVDVSSLLLSGTGNNDHHRGDVDFSFTNSYHNRYMPRPPDPMVSLNSLSLSQSASRGAAASIGQNNIPPYIVPLIANDFHNNQNRLLTAYLNSNPSTNAELATSRQHPSHLQQQKQLQQQQQLRQQIQRQQQVNNGGGDGNGGFGGQSTTEKYASQSQWGYQVLPTLYSIYQKVQCASSVPSSLLSTTTTSTTSTTYMLPTVSLIRLLPRKVDKSTLFSFFGCLTPVLWLCY